MALFSECTDRYAQKLLDTADIVREAMFRQEASFSVRQHESHFQLTFDRRVLPPESERSELPFFDRRYGRRRLALAVQKSA